MSYYIELPGKRYVEIPDTMPQEEAFKHIYKSFPELAPKPETTALGHTKEILKGIIPGAAGMLESSVKGASALLPEETEKAVTAKARELVSPVEEYFKAAPGYEDAFSRKLGEGIGSTLPYFALGPLGLAGRAGAAGLGMAAGAGEARARAELGGATGGDRALATLGGAAVGATELIPVLGFVKRLHTAEQLRIFDMIKRAAVQGGEEAAQEMASNVLQNAIAKGLYKPDEALLNGIGEAGSVGGATGAIIQGLTDLALGKRGHLARLQHQGESAIDKAEKEKAAKEAEKTQASSNYLSFGDLAALGNKENGYGQVEQYKQRLLSEPKSAARDSALKEVKDYQRIANEELAKRIAPPTVENPHSPTGQFQIPLLGMAEAAAANEEAKAAQETPAPVAGNLFTKDVIDSLGISKQAKGVRKLTNANLDNTDELANVIAALDTFAHNSQNKEAANKAGEYKKQLEAKYDEYKAESTGSLFDKPRRKRKSDAATTEPTDAAGTTVTSEPVTTGATDAGVAVANEPNVVAPTVGIEPSGVVVPSEPAAAGNGADASGDNTLVEQPTTEGQAPWMQLPKQTFKQFVKGIYKEVVDDLFLPKGSAAAEANIAGRRRAEEARVGQTTSAKTEEQLQRGYNEPSEAPVIQTSIDKRLTSLLAEEEKLTQELQALKTPAGRVPNKGAARERYNSKKQQLEKVQWNIGDLSPKLKSEYEPPVRGNINPVQEQQLRGELYTLTEALKTRARQVALINQQNEVANLTGNEERKAELLSQWEEAKAAEKEVERAAEKVYNKLFDVKADTRELSREEAKAFDKANKDRIAAREYERTHPKTAKELGEFPYNFRTVKNALRWADVKGVLSTPQVKTWQKKWNKLSPEQREKNPQALIELQEALDPQVSGILYSKNAYYGGVKQSAKMADMLDRGFSANDILEYVSRSGSISEFRQLAKFLAARNLSPKIRFGVTEKGVPAAYDAATNTIVIQNRENMEYNFLHEYVHAATAKAIEKQTPAGREINEIYKVYKEAGNNDADYGFKDAYEFASEALSNPLFAAKLTRMADPRSKLQTLWDRFLNAVRRAVGLSPKQANSNTDPIGRLFQLTEQTAIEGQEINAQGQYAAPPLSPAALQPTANVDPIGDQKKLGLFGQFIADMTGRPGLKTEIYLANSAAALMRDFADAFNGQIRSAAGTLNPSILISRARDSARFALSVMKTGTLARNPQSGLQVATELTINPETNADHKGFDQLTPGEQVTVVKVRSEITEEAKRLGIPFDALKKRVDERFWGHRMYELIQRNNDLERQAQAATNPKAAAMLRAQMKNVPTDPATLAAINQLEASFQAEPTIRRWSQMLDAIRFSLIDEGVKSHRFTPDYAQSLKDATGYIPFDRLGDWENNYAIIKKKGGVANLKPIKPFEGSDRQTNSPLDTYISTIEYLVKEAMNNEATYKSLSAMELLNMARRVPTINAIPKDKQKTHYIEVYDGIHDEKVGYEINDPLHFFAFQYQEPSVNAGTLMLQRAAQFLRAGVTTMPPFAIKQVIDDITRAYVYSGVENPREMIPRILWNFPKMWFAEMAGRKLPVVRELERRGIVGTYDWNSSDNLKQIAYESGSQKRGFYDALIHYAEAMAKSSDLAVREAIYKQTLKESNGNEALAESRAREIINFSRSGRAQWVATLAKMIPFTNAYIQGMDKLLSARKGENIPGLSRNEARSMFRHRMTVLTAMGFTYAIAMSDDEDYNALEDHIRDRYWVLPKIPGQTTPFVISIPAELGFIFKAIPERIVRAIKTAGTPQERDALYIMGELVKRGFDVYFAGSYGMPTAARPVFENIVNYSLYLGRPLESASQEAKPKFLREGTGTSEIGKIAARAAEDISTETGLPLRFSPIMFDNLIRGWFGTAAGTISAVADAFMNPDRTDRPLYRQVLPQVTGASTFMQDPVGRRHSNYIFELNEKATQVHNGYNDILKKDPAKANEFATKNSDLYLAYDYIKSLKESYDSIRDEIKLVDNYKNMPSEDRRALINEKMRLQDQIGRQAEIFYHYLRRKKAE